MSLLSHKGEELRALTCSSHPRDNAYMRAVLKLTALNLALAAMLLGALIPAGWMPSAREATGSPFVICTIEGAVQPKPAHDADRGHAAPCTFAAAAALSPPAAFAEAPTALTFALVAFCGPRDAIPARIARHRSAAPRAPPAFA